MDGEKQWSEVALTGFDRVQKRSSRHAPAITGLFYSFENGNARANVHALAMRSIDPPTEIFANKPATVMDIRCL
jgi:hypothetical protein